MMMMMMMMMMYDDDGDSGAEGAELPQDGAAGDASWHKTVQHSAES